MQRIILIFALLFWSGAVFAQTHAAFGPDFRLVPLYWHHAVYSLPPVVPAPVVYPVPYPAASPIAYPVRNFVAPTSPSYVFVGSNSPARPQLVFKDGTTHTVADYWRVDDQLHFVTIEEGGTKSVPHIVAFDDLDLQRTRDVAAAQGFRFVIRDKPIEQWLEHHNEHLPRSRKKE